MSNEENPEMYQQLFSAPVYDVGEEQDISSFCLSDKPAKQTRLLVLLKDEKNEKAQAADLEMLNKIADFKDYHLKREEVQVVNLAFQSPTFLELAKKFSSPNILAFGIDPAEIDLQLESHPTQLLRFRGVNFVFSLSLQQMTKDDKLKNQFFREALKPMFLSTNPANL